MIDKKTMIATPKVIIITIPIEDTTKVTCFWDIYKAKAYKKLQFYSPRHMIDTNKHKSHGIFPTTVTAKECSDTGMAMVLIALLIGWFTEVKEYHLAAIILLVLNMVWARAYSYVAKGWLGFSTLLGTVMSKILLSLVFFVVVTPLALLRRMLGHDPMQLGKWKKDSTSVFESRDHTFTAEEIELPY
tara:strand:- start:20057 stop:20617 length:561 start_codon:yes stop_codon:yes gene_type:complete